MYITLETIIIILFVHINVYITYQTILIVVEIYYEI